MAKNEQTNNGSGRNEVHAKDVEGKKAFDQGQYNALSNVRNIQKYNIMAIFNCIDSIREAAKSAENPDAILEELAKIGFNLVDLLTTIDTLKAYVESTYEPNKH